MDSLADFFKSFDELPDDFNTGSLFVRSLRQFLKDVIGHKTRSYVFIEKEAHPYRSYQDDFGDDGDMDGSHPIHELMEGIDVEDGRREKILGSQPGQCLQHPQLHVGHLLAPGRIHS